MGFIKSLGNSALVVKHKSPDKAPVLCGQIQFIDNAELKIMTFLRSLIKKDISLLSDMTDDEKFIMCSKIISFLEKQFQNDAVAFENERGQIVVHATETRNIEEASNYLQDNFHKTFVKVNDVQKHYSETYLKQEIKGLADINDCTSIIPKNMTNGHAYIVLGFGNKCGFDNLTEKLKRIIDGILSAEVTLKGSNISEYADVVCKGIEKKWNVLLDFHNLVEVPNVASIKGVTVTLINGRIEDQEVQALINSTGPNLKLDKGSVSKSILQKAGPELQKECDDKGPLIVGQVVETLAYNLPCSCIFHCLGKEYDESNPEESQEVVMKLVSTCLDMANIKYLNSIAFPPLACGVLKMPPQLSAKCILSSIESYAWSSQHTLKSIKLAIYDPRVVFQAYQQVLNAKLNNSESAWKNIKGRKVSIVGSSQDSLDKACKILSKADLKKIFG